MTASGAGEVFESFGSRRGGRGRKRAAPGAELARGKERQHAEGAGVHDAVRGEVEQNPLERRLLGAGGLT